MSQDQAKLKGYVEEVMVGMQRRRDATSFIRDVLNTAKEDGLCKKQIRNLAKLALEQNAQVVRAEVNELVDTYEQIGL